MGFLSCVSAHITPSAAVLNEMHTDSTERPESPGKGSSVYFQLESSAILGAFPWKGFRGAAWSPHHGHSANVSWERPCAFHESSSSPGSASRRKGLARQAMGRCPGHVTWMLPFPQPGPGSAVAPNSRRLSPNSSSAPAEGSACRGASLLAGGAACAEAWQCDLAWPTVLTERGWGASLPKSSGTSCISCPDHETPGAPPVLEERKYPLGGAVPF